MNEDLLEVGEINDSLPSKIVVFADAIKNIRDLMNDESCDFKTRLDASCALINIASQVLK